MLENPYNEEYPGHICFMDASQEKRTVTGDRKEFFGTGDIELPECLQRKSLSGSVGVGFDPCGAIQVKASLEPNESKDIVLTLGMASNKTEVEELTLKYRDVKTAIESMLKVRKFWSEKLEIIQVNTPSAATNFMLNGWLQYQLIVCRLWARSGFYQSGGAFGFRDQLQDCLSVVKVWPLLARKQILLHAKHQFLQGDVQHWWHEPRVYGTRTRISDDRLWLPYVTAEYIRVTGDNEILAVELSYLDDDLLLVSEDERYSKPCVSDVKETLFEHCVRTIEFSLTFGSHGLPLFGSGDWNDGMNTVGNLGKGESVWLGWFLVAVLDSFIPICKQMKQKDLADKYTHVKNEIVEAIEKNAWDGNWYLRAYFDNGRPLGSAQNIDCRIDSISQSWSVISGAANPKRATEAMSSLEENLVSRKDGIIKLLKPPFDQGDSEPGYIKGYIPGVRENGGQYSHAAAWVVIAYAKLGNGDKAWELFDLINPINHSDNVREQMRYKVEPYVMAADVYAANPHTGRGGWTWYTGAAGWMYTAGIESILGFNKRGETLFIDPCIPVEWNQYSLKYRYKNTVYSIKVKNPRNISKGVKKISVDKKISAGNQINLIDDGKTHIVEVIMGI
jgi:cellobiose phosphorylase